MKALMDVARATEMVKQIASARKRWGRYAYPPYTQAELMDALVVLYDAGRFDGPSDEDITRLRRQLAACLNREKAARRS